MADEAPEIRHLTMEQLRIAHTVLAEVFKDDIALNHATNGPALRLATRSCQTSRC